MLLLLSTAAIANQIPNGDFEIYSCPDPSSPSTMDVGLAPGWTRTHDTADLVVLNDPDCPDATASGYGSGARVHAGHGGARVHTDFSHPNIERLATAALLEAGQAYEIAMWVYPDAPVTLGFRIEDPTTGTSTYIEEALSAGAWYRLAGTYVAGSTGPHELEFGNFSGTGGEGMTWIDDASAEVAECADYLIQDLTYSADTTLEAASYIHGGYDVGGPGPTGNVSVPAGVAVTWRAGDEVVLEDGFSTEAGATFIAEIAPCGRGTEADADGDGYTTETDCDDADPSVYPGAAEVYYDGVDQNCVGDSDYDQDGDGADAADYGGADCDDTNASVVPGGREVPRNGVDDNCDGVAW